MFQLSNIEVIRDDRTILKVPDLTIPTDKLTVVLGHNGSGKSTLLRVISGIYPPDEGTVHAAGDISLLAGLGTGFSAHQTGRENALLYGSILGHSEEEMRAKRFACVPQHRKTRIVSREAL